MNLVYDPYICSECENTMICRDCCNPVNCIGHSFIPKEIKGVLKILLNEHQIIYNKPQDINEFVSFHEDDEESEPIKCSYNELVNYVVK